MTSRNHLPGPVQRQLNAVRGMLRTYVTVQSLLLIVGWLLIVFWLGALLDYLPVRAGSNETPRWLRIGLLSAMAAGSLWILLRWTLPRLRTPVRDRSLALLIERSYPSLNNELVTTVELDNELGDEFSNPAAHAAMLERVRESVTQKVAQVNPSQLFNWQPIWAAGTAVAFGLAITGITAIGMNDWLSLWAQRLFTLSDQAWPRTAELRADGVQLQFPAFTGQTSAERVMLAFDSGLVRVPSGATALLQISANADAKQVPEVCTIFYRAADGARGRANMRRVGSPRQGWQQFTLDGPPLDAISQDMSLDVVGLDARLRDLRLQVVDPAVISDMKLECIYPKYLLDQFSSRPERETLDYRIGMRIPEGTLVSLVGQSSCRLSKVEYVLRASGANADSPPTGEQATPTADGEPRIQVVMPDGDQFRIPLGSIRSSRIIELRLIDEFGLSSDQIPRYVFSIIEDAPPVVDSKLAGIGNAITPKALLPIRGTATDDNGVSEVMADLVFNESQQLSVPLQIFGEGEIQTDVDLEKLAAGGLSIAPEMSLGLVVSARDKFDLDETQHIGTGQPQQLAIVTEDQLLVMLDRQELELRQRLELIISELQQVSEVLEQLGSSLETPGQAALFGLRLPMHFVVLQENDPEDSVDQLAQQRRMAVLRSQQSMLQCDKSQQELGGIISRVDNLRLQLLNNRIDSYDRQNRLQQKVHDPLVALLAGDYRELDRGLAELQTATMSGEGFVQAKAALAALAKVIDALEAIKSNMLDIESFNEIVDLVRSLLEDQEGILDATEKQQKARILDLLK